MIVNLSFACSTETAIDLLYMSIMNYVLIFTARCTLVQSAVLPSHVVCLSVCLSVCNVGEL